MKLRPLLRLLTVLFAALSVSGTAHAQYYEIANQLPSLISPAISGSLNYKGFIEAGYSRTLGNYNADFLEISTSQGFKYADWFFMGVGIGVDVLFAHQNNSWGNWNTNNSGNFDFNHSSTKTAAMLPLFTDFRFNIGGSQSVSFYADIKIGCSFLLSNQYIAIGDGYLTNQQYFYLHPSIGLRIPTNVNNSKQAFDVGISYKLLTSNYWSNWNRDVTLNALGVTVAYEW